MKRLRIKELLLTLVLVIAFAGTSLKTYADNTDNAAMAQYYYTLATQGGNSTVTAAQAAELAKYYAQLVKMEASGKTTQTAQASQSAQATQNAQAAALIQQQNQIFATLMSYKTIYPEGMSWGFNSHTYTWSKKIYPKSGLIGMDCVAFAMILSDAAFGKNPVKIYNDVSQIRVGDIIRIKNDTHSVVITMISADGTYTLAEANYNGKVHWGRTLSNSEMRATFCYGWTRY